MIISSTEMEDFQTALREERFSRADFKLTTGEERFPEGQLAVPRGTVTITNTKRDRSKTYRAGGGTSWPAEFHLDLRKRVFGEP